MLNRPGCFGISPRAAAIPRLPSSGMPPEPSDKREDMKPSFAPMLATLAGRRQILLFDGEQIAGYDVAGSGPLWSLPWKTMQGINVAQPLVLEDDRVLISSGYGVGCAMLKISQTDGKFHVEQLW